MKHLHVHTARSALLQPFRIVLVAAPGHTKDDSTYDLNIGVMARRCGIVCAEYFAMAKTCPKKNIKEVIEPFKVGTTMHQDAPSMHSGSAWLSLPTDGRHL